MFRFSSLALASVAAIGCSVAVPNVSRADFDLRIGIGRSYLHIGDSRPVIVAPPPVVYPVRSAPVFVDPGCSNYGPRPSVVVPNYGPYPAGYRGYGPVIAPPHHRDHHHHGHHSHYPRPRY